MIPIRTDRSLRAVPYVTYSLLFLNLFVFLTTINYSDAAVIAHQRHWGLVLSDMNLYSWFTHAFVHGDWTHLLSNMLILWIVGTVLECGIGSLPFAILYFASMLGAEFLQGVITYLFQPEGLSIYLIGASGAIAGITGFAAFRYYHIRILTFVAVPNFVGFPRWLLVIPVPVPFWAPFWAYAAYFGGKELILGIGELMEKANGGVAHWAHLGGMGLGLLAALYLRSYQEGKRELALEDSAKAATGNQPKRYHSLEELQKLLRQHPNDPELLEAMAAVIMANGDAVNSRVLFVKALPLFMKSGQLDHAAMCYLNVLRTGGDVGLTSRDQLKLASTLETMGHFHDAAEAFGSLAERCPHCEEAETALLRAAQIHHKQLQAAPEAMRLLNTLVTQYPLSNWQSLAKDRLREIQRETR